MLYVTIQNNTVTIDEQMKVNGRQPWKSVVENEIDSIDPVGNHAPNNMAYLYDGLSARGFDVDADEGDLTVDDLPAGSVS